MTTDKNPIPDKFGEEADESVESRQDTLRWLMEMDRDEPEESLFKVEDDFVPGELSAYEREVASRPLVRGRTDADDLASYVEEEIVISSDIGGIYTSGNSNEPSVKQRAPQVDDSLMAVDFSPNTVASLAGEGASLAEGQDILGIVPVPAEAGTPLEEVPELSLEQDRVEDEPPVSAPESSPEAPDVSLQWAGEDPAYDLEEVTLELPVLPPAPEDLADQPEAVEPQLELVGNETDGEVVEDMVDWDLPDEFHDELLTPYRAQSMEVVLHLPEVSVNDAVFEVEQAPEEERASAGCETEQIQGEEVEPQAVQPAGEDPDGFSIFEDNIFDFRGESILPQLEVEGSEDIEAVFDDIDQMWREEEALVDRQEEPPEAAWLPPEPPVETEAMAEIEEPAPELPAQVIDIAAAAVEQDLSWCIPKGIEFSYTSRSGAEIFDDFLEAFLEEGSVELEKLEDAVAAWEAEPHSEAAYSVVARSLHTLKGIAKGVGLQFYGTYIHNFETLLEGMDRPGPGGERDYFRIVNVWLDGAVQGLESIRGRRADVSSELPVADSCAGEEVEGPAVATIGEVPEVEAELSDMPRPQAMPPAPEEIAAREEARADRKALDKKLADEGARVLAAQQSVRITSDKLDHLLNLSNQAQQLGVRTAQSNTRGKRASLELHGRLASVRAHLDEITQRALFQANSRHTSQGPDMDALEMDRYSELHEVANILREGIEDLVDLLDQASRQNGEVEALLKQQLSVISSLGASIRAARVVPVSRLMPGLRRLVRTVSSDLDRQASFQVKGEVGTLDRDDYARCQIILEHMVRNALDHGIEPAAERAKAGKPAEGTIGIDVRQSGGNTLICLSDDGRGIDPDSLRQSAVEKGIDVDVDSLDDQEAMRLIFHKGFSTASSVSEISGRGVGMDIVLSELQQMGGDIQIESRRGEGTRFHIRIPSNVAVNGALLVGAGASSYAIPLGGLLSIEHVPAEDFFGAVETGRQLTLGEFDCVPAYLGSLCEGVPLPERKQWGATVPVIVAGNEGRHMAIAIDHVEEALELVIRTLGPQFAEVPGVAGAATTADGQAVVALDLNLMVESFASEDLVSLSVPAEGDDPLLVMVVDDSRTQRKVATSQLEAIGAETVTAENGAVAIELLNSLERLPDVVLLDIEMPVKDGIQTLRDIRKSSRFSHLPVIMVTSRTGLKHRTMAQQAGCSGYMGKPFHFPMLVGMINELTGQRLKLPEGK